MDTDKLYKLCTCMFIIGALGLEVLGIVILFYMNILIGIGFLLVVLIADSLVLYSYLDYITED